MKSGSHLFYFSHGYAPIVLTELRRLRKRVELDEELRADERLVDLTDPEYTQLISRADAGGAVVIVMDAEMFELLAAEIDPNRVKVA
jgi:hypothetical protein